MTYFMCRKGSYYILHFSYLFNIIFNERTYSMFKWRLLERISVGSESHSNKGGMRFPLGHQLNKFMNIYPEIIVIIKF